MKYRIVSVVIFALLLISITPIFAQDNSDFPITIEHKYGSTTFTEYPERVISVGYTEQDMLLALGITPVAIRYWYGDETDAVLPWADDYVEGEQPIVLDMRSGLNFEAILALEPDLITGVTSGMTQEEYDLLSQIAPTLPQSGDYIDYGMPWQESMRMIGTAVGQADEAEAIIAEVDGMFVDIRERYPQFAGKTVAPTYSFDGSFGFYTAQDTRGQFFENMGFVVPDELVEIAGEAFYANLSEERIDILDQDLIAFVNLQFYDGGREALESDPLFGQLAAVQEGRIVYFDALSENALHYSSPLSLPFAIEAILPQLEAIFGEPVESDTDSASIECEAGFRPMTHAMGESCIPENPQRVAPLDMAIYELMLITGQQPGISSELVLTTYADMHPELEDTFNELMATAPDIGFPPNLEVVVNAEPDLIIGFKDFFTESIYSVLDNVAPTVLYDPPYGDWRTRLIIGGEALGQSEVVEQLLADYDARVLELQEILGENRGDIEISLVRTLPGQVGLVITGSAAAYVLDDVGLGRPEAQTVDYDTVIADMGGRPEILISEENIDLADGDYVFLFGDTDEILANPLWDALPAVADGRSFEVGYYWWGDTLLSAHDMLDDLFEHVAGVESTIPNPFENGIPASE